MKKRQDDEEESRRSFGVHRIEALADGVFAIAMTLLVLEIKLPKPIPGEDASIMHRVMEVLPKFVTYCLSFLICGVFWISHQAIIHFVRKSDRVFLWMNVLFLMVVSAVPFSAALLGDYHPDPMAITVYCTNILVCGLIQLAMTAYAIGRANLVVDPLDPKLKQVIYTRLLICPIASVIGIGSAWFTPELAMFICIGTLCFYILPGKIDRYIVE